MSELRQNGLLCDVTIKLEYNGQKYKFPAHKLVLAACSPYFKAMFTGRQRLYEATNAYLISLSDAYTIRKLESLII